MIATSANISGLRKLILTLSCADFSTALRVTSEPELAVVGIAINGSGLALSGTLRPTTST
ncbi:Uncharacterised protein [Vibrio cholerae]|nr:Uncharacterised protein [Vibrio cholerae]CSI65003.1 Uncharacterised protein [Vibrio cholerae]